MCYDEEVNIVKICLSRFVNVLITRVGDEQIFSLSRWMGIILV